MLLLLFASAGVFSKAAPYLSLSSPFLSSSCSIVHRTLFAHAAWWPRGVRPRPPTPVTLGLGFVSVGSNWHTMRSEDLAERLRGLNAGTVVRHRPFASCADLEARRWSRVLSRDEAVACAGSFFAEGEWSWDGGEARVVTATTLSWCGATAVELRARLDTDCLTDVELRVEGRVNIDDESSQLRFWLVCASGAHVAPLALRGTSVEALACGVDSFIRFYDRLEDAGALRDPRKVALVVTRGESCVRIPARLAIPSPCVVAAAAANSYGAEGAPRGRSWRAAAAAAYGAWAGAPTIDASTHELVVEPALAASWSPRATSDELRYDMWTAALQAGLDVDGVEIQPTTQQTTVVGFDDDDDARAFASAARRLGKRSGGLGTLLRGTEACRARISAPCARTCMAIADVALRDRLRLFRDFGEPRSRMARLVAEACGACFVVAESDSLFSGSPFLAIGAWRRTDDDDDAAVDDEDEHLVGMPVFLLELERALDESPERSTNLATALHAAAILVNPLVPLRADELTVSQVLCLPGVEPYAAVLGVDTLLPDERLFVDAMRARASHDTLAELRRLPIDRTAADDKHPAVAAALDGTPTSSLRVSFDIARWTASICSSCRSSVSDDGRCRPCCWRARVWTHFRDIPRRRSSILRWAQTRCRVSVGARRGSMQCSAR